VFEPSVVLSSGDLLAFFSALRPVDSLPRPLIYALIGLYMIEEIAEAKSVPKERWLENAHTRACALANAQPQYSAYRSIALNVKSPTNVLIFMSRSYLEIEMPALRDRVIGFRRSPRLLAVGIILWLHLESRTMISSSPIESRTPLLVL
jgi:hypothetical protein